MGEALLIWTYIVAAAAAAAAFVVVDAGYVVIVVVVVVAAATAGVGVEQARLALMRISLAAGGLPRQPAPNHSKASRSRIYLC